MDVPFGYHPPSLPSCPYLILTSQSSSSRLHQKKQGKLLREWACPQPASHGKNGNSAPICHVKRRPSLSSQSGQRHHGILETWTTYLCFSKFPDWATKHLRKVCAVLRGVGGRTWSTWLPRKHLFEISHSNLKTHARSYICPRIFSWLFFYKNNVLPLSPWGGLCSKRDTSCLSYGGQCPQLRHKTRGTQWRGL